MMSYFRRFEFQIKFEQKLGICEAGHWWPSG